MIISEQDYLDFGNTYGLNNSVELCTHDTRQTRDYVQKHSDIVINKNAPSTHSNFWDSSGIKGVGRTILGVIVLLCFIFIAIFIKELCEGIWIKIKGKKRGPLSYVEQELQSNDDSNS